MARPIRADAEATRARILVAATALFSERGLAQATLREIGRAAGVTMATVHHYFGGKGDLYRACVDAMYDEIEALREQLESALSDTRARDSSLDTLIEEGVRRAYRFARKHRPAVQLMMRVVLDTGELDPDRRERHLLPFLDWGAELFAPLLGRPRRDVRCALLSLNHLIVRFTLSSPREIALVLDGTPGGDPDVALAAVEDYLVSVAKKELSPKGEGA